jgi:hypothetical protein
MLGPFGLFPGWGFDRRFDGGCGIDRRDVAVFAFAYILGRCSRPRRWC